MANIRKFPNGRVQRTVYLDAEQVEVVKEKYHNFNGFVFEAVKEKLEREIYDD